eukprot:CAMPEP_0114149888 /NCGR_PEP_ID=MMETSP0043_2-20121206/22408_1 /TAXON_ID=464988 /ORGANISM="Hemiselmis andersenii, Strain CCMP644" /LENGTH=228 /DNA_ID=CAMNT_0001244579 /DNA_START=200 /DNA_END=883 /DNA_ORIENTATION=+
MSDGRSFPRTASKRAILVPETDVFMVPAEGIEDAYGGPSMEDLLVFGEISKFVWYLTPSVHAEARANYIMLQEWIDVYMSIMKVCRSKFNERKMETEARNLFKEVIPDYISVSQKMDFFNFNEALATMCMRRLPKCTIGARMAWLACAVNRLVERNKDGGAGGGDSEFGDESRQRRRASVLEDMETGDASVWDRVTYWIGKHQNTNTERYDAASTLAGLYYDGATDRT